MIKWWLLNSVTFLFLRSIKLGHLNLNRDFLKLWLFLCHLFYFISFSPRLCFLLKFLLFLVEFYLINSLLCFVKPFVETNTVVHSGQKWIYRLALTKHILKELLLIFKSIFLVLRLTGDLVNSKLSIKLNDLHFAVKLKVTILWSHAPVE